MRTPFHPLRFAVVLACLGASATTLAQKPGLQVIDETRHFLGSLGPREWEDYDGRKPEGRELVVKFQATANQEAATLFIRQEDVKQDWPVKINDRKLGILERIENDLVATFDVPAGTLREGENVLHILAAKAPDDIIVGAIHLDPRPREQAVADASATVSVTAKENGAPLPCRLTIVDEAGTLVPVRSMKPARTAARAGVVYTGDGQAELGLRPGNYTLYATRGFEYSLAIEKLNLAAGASATVRLQLTHEVPTEGLVACDTHVHSLEFSGHGDATAAERAITVAGEGIELPVATDHNVYADYAPATRATGTEKFFTNVIGTEVTTPTGHFNAFPVATATTALPNHKLNDWPQLMQSIRGVPGMQVIILNHPRDVHNNFIPFAPENFNAVTGENLRGEPFSFDAMEIVNSGALQSDVMQTFRDWFALLNQGYRITAVGSSDCHDVSRFIVGQGRSYVAAKDGAPDAVDVAEACRSFKAGRVYPSLGLLTRMTVEETYEAGDLAAVKGNEMRVRIRVLGPSWIDAETVTLYQNGVKLREQSLEREPARVEKAVIDWKLPRPPHDVHLVAIATGPGVRENYWRLASPYQPTARKRSPRVVGATNPVWIDADNDGQFTAARLQAEAMLKSISAAEMEPSAVVDSLTLADEAVAAQAAAILQKRGADLRTEGFAAALKRANPPVQAGFQSYLATQK